MYLVRHEKEGADENNWVEGEICIATITPREERMSEPEGED